MKPIRFALCILTLIGLASCGGNKTTDVSSEETVNQEYSPMDLYFSVPTAMLVSPGGGDNATAYLPDFINYPNDLAKLGLRGNVKECVAGVSTIKFTYKFNPQGNLSNYQFRMDSRGSFGEGAKLEYDELGHLTLLGRDFRGQTPNSHKYIYEDDVLIRREYGSGFRLYEWIEEEDGHKIPNHVINKGLKPAMEMKYTRNENGHVVLAEMNYNKPNLPGPLTAKSGNATFEHLNDGRLAKVTTAYSGCSNRQYPISWGECEYTYNPQGDVEKMIFTLYDSNEEARKQLYTVTQTYTYTYDSYGNWTSVSMDSTDPQPGNISTFTRSLTYYTEEEIAAEKQALADKPLIGQWRFKETDKHTYDNGEEETIENTCTIVLNLYDRFIPDGYYDDPKLGIIFSESLPSLGMEQYGSWDIIDAKINGNSVDIRIKGFNCGDEYTAKLEYNPKDKSLSLSNLKLSKKEPETDPDEASDFETYDLEPFEGKHKFLKRSTSNE